MSLNWKEIDLVLEELALPGCHIQEIVQPDFRSLVFEMYRPGEPFRLLISLAPNRTRIHRISARPRKPRTIQRFVEFLRARVRGGRVVVARQINADRIVLIDVERAGQRTRIWVRLWGGAANIIVTDDEDTILDAFFRRPKRGEVSGERFSATESAAASAGKKQPPEAFSVRELPGDGDFNARLEDHYELLQEETEHDELKKRLARALDDRESRIRTTLGRLRDRLAGYENPDRYKVMGDLITANLYRIHRGDRWLQAENFYEGNRKVDIELDPTRDPSANAEAYYDRYKKAKSGLEIVREEIEQLERELKTTLVERTALDETEDLAALREQSATVVRRARSEKRKGGEDSREGPPGLAFESHGFRILVGRTARENDALLRHFARGNDTWLHARDYPGAYVFVKHIPGKSVPLETLLDAGNLAVFYSKARSSGHAELYYTKVKYLRRPKEGKLGLVLPTQEKNLSVRLDDARLKRLQDGTG